MFPDASALLAYLLHEPGQATVLEAIAAGVHMTTIDFAEVASRYVANGASDRGVLTADRVWTSVSEAVGVPVYVIR